MERKSLALADTQIKLEGDDATFTGYASTFGNVDAGAIRLSKVLTATR